MKLFLDGNNLAMRCRTAPRLSKMSLPDGQATGLIHAFLASVFFFERALHAHAHDVTVVWDGENLRRRAANPRYKAHRRPPPEADTRDIAWVKRHLPLFGWRQDTGVDEADDRIATLVRRGTGESAIVSTDRDFLPLASASTIVCVPASKPGAKVGKSGFKAYNPLFLRGAFGVGPEAFPLLRAIVGDTSDGVEGVPGLSWKLAAKILTPAPDDEIVDVNMLFARAPGRETKLQRKRLLENEALVRANVKLLALDVASESACRVEPEPDLTQATAALQSMKLRKIESLLLQRERDRRQTSIC